MSPRGSASPPGEAALNHVDFTPALRAAIDRGAERLAEGRLVAFPTETVYGLGADAADPAAVAAIYAAKGRPAGHPLIVHVPVGADLAGWTRDVPDEARALIDRFWPGPLTLILPRRPGVGEEAAGGQDSIGLRCPAHPVAQALLIAYDMRRTAQDRHAPVGIAAPSANRFGRVSPTRAAHVLDEFGAGAATDGEPDILVVDGGDCEVGIESTILDCSRLATVGPVLLRPGAVTAAMIAEVVGREPQGADAQAPRASGTLDSHYAPVTPVRLVDAATIATAGSDVVVWGWSLDREAFDRRTAPRDVDAYAHALYATLRELDHVGAREIWIEAPPRTPEWAGVHDRLRRAAHPR